MLDSAPDRFLVCGPQYIAAGKQGKFMVTPPSILASWTTSEASKYYAQSGFRSIRVGLSEKNIEEVFLKYFAVLNIRV